MATNIGFDNGHPYVEEGADEGEIVMVGDRLAVTPKGARAVSFTLERSIDNGVTWEHVTPDDVSSGEGVNLIDWESLSHGDTMYRAVAYTIEGATAETIITVESRSGALWISAGAGFEITGRLPLDPNVSISAGRQRALKYWAGRTLPVPYTGETLARVINVSGTTTDRNPETADIDTLTRIAQNEYGLFLFRDPDGNRIYGTIGPIDMPRQHAINHPSGWEGVWGYSFQLTEAERE